MWDIAIDDSLKGVSGRDAACGWAVAQLDYDKEEEPWYDTYGTMLAELGKCRERVKEQNSGRSLSSLIGPYIIHADTVGSLDGLWRGEGGIGTKQKDVKHWKLLMICAEKIVT